MRRNEYEKAEYYLSSTFRNYIHSEPRFRALLTEGAPEAKPALV
jgi:hypothetical protein